MRYSTLHLTLITVVLFVLLTAPASAAERDFDSVAVRVVNHALKVQPGESVVINGTPAELDLMSSLVVAVWKAGGIPTVQLSIPEADKRALMEMPLEYMTFTPTFALMQLRAADCFINTGSVQQPGLFADVPEEKFAAFRKSGLVVTRSNRTAKFRSVDLGQTGGLPTKAFAELRGANFDQMEEMFWKAVDADYEQIARSGKEISEHLRPSTEVQVTSSAGTDVRFRLGNAHPTVNAGRTGERSTAIGPDLVFLPAGEVYVSVDPSSASGTIVVPSFWFRAKEIKNLRLNFKNGILSSLSGDSDVGAVNETLATGDDQSKALSVIDIGLNPASQPLKGSSYYSFEMGGMVTLGIGANAWAGGDVIADFALFFHLPLSTVKVGGKTIVEKGRLKVE